MHEISLMEQTLNIALENAIRQGAARIHCLRMRVGAISGVVPEALEFAFDVLSKETIARGATLEIETVPVVCYCPCCDLEFQPPDFVWECPQCQKISSQLLSGREIELSSMEVS